MPSSSPATTSPAGATVTACGRAPSMRAQRRRVGRLDALAVRAPGALQQRHDLGVAAGRRAPVDVDHLGALRAHRVGERRQPDVDGAHALQHAGARVMPDLAHLAAAVRAAPGLLGKRDLRAARRPAASRSTATTPRSSRTATASSSLCGEAIAPALLAADPFAAGAAAVVTNVSDVRAMGGRPLALVDTLVSPDREHAERVLDGLAWAAERLGVPVVGGHLTLGAPPALSAFCTGSVTTPLRAAAARPGDVLLAAFCLEGAIAATTRRS